MTHYLFVLLALSFLALCACIVLLFKRVSRLEKDLSSCVDDVLQVTYLLDKFTDRLDKVESTCISVPSIREFGEFNSKRIEDLQSRLYRIPRIKRYVLSRIRLYKH